MANNKKQIYLALVVFILFGSLIVYANMRDTSKTVNEIMIEKASLLSNEAYLTDIRKNLNKTQLQEVDEIKKYFISHPYIKNCEVYFPAPNKLKVNLEEKLIVAQIISNEKKYLVSADGEIIDKIIYTNPVNLPLVTGITCDGKSLVQSEQNKLNSLLSIINSYKTVSGNLSKSLSEITWKSESQAILFVREFSAPIYVNLKSVDKQAVYLEALLNSKQVNSSALQYAAYVDMRYDKYIFIGNESSTEIE